MNSYIREDKKCLKIQINIVKPKMSKNLKMLNKLMLAKQEKILRILINLELWVL